MEAKEKNLKKVKRVRVRVSFRHPEKDSNSHVLVQNSKLPEDQWWDLSAVFAAPPRVR